MWPVIVLSALTGWNILFCLDAVISTNAKESHQCLTQKTEFFKTANSRYFFAKILKIGPRVSRINWCAFSRISLSKISGTNHFHALISYVLFFSLQRPKWEELSFWGFLRQRCLDAIICHALISLCFIFQLATSKVRRT